MTARNGLSAATLGRRNRTSHPRPDAAPRSRATDRHPPSDSLHRNLRARRQTPLRPCNRQSPSDTPILHPRSTRTQRPHATEHHSPDGLRRQNRNPHPQRHTDDNPHGSENQCPQRQDRTRNPLRHLRTRADRRSVIRNRWRNRVPARWLNPTRRPRILTDRQSGFATAELAAALPAIVLLLLTGLFAVNAVSTQTRCTDAAREAVLTQARGEDGRTAANRHLPPHAQVDITSTSNTVTAEISATVRPLGSLLPAMTVTGRATAAREDQETP